MSTFLENTEQDWALSNGRLQLVSDARAIAQKTENDFRFFLAEWFLDQSEGVPWFQKVLVKNPDLNVLRNLFRGVVLSNPSISSVQSFNMQFNKPKRSYSYQFVALSFTGQQITGGGIGSVPSVP